MNFLEVFRINEKHFLLNHVASKLKPVDGLSAETLQDIAATWCKVNGEHKLLAT